MEPFKVFSTFTGIGGFEVGIRNATANPIEVVGYSEIDKYAISVYEKHFNGVKNYGDITKIKADDLADFDCLVGGFPCQAFSIAGKRRGFDDTRGTLFFDLARILRAKRPKLFVFENVKGLLNHDNGNTFRTILAAIDGLGYDCQWQVLNSKNFGVPQNRERIIIVGHIRGEPRPQVFPITRKDTAPVRASGDDEQGSQKFIKTRHLSQNGRLISDSTTLQASEIPHLLDVAYPGREPKSYRKIAPTVRNYGSGGNKMPMVITGHPSYGSGKRSMKYKISEEAPTIRATQHKSGDNQPKIVIYDDYNSKIRNDNIAGTLTTNTGSQAPRNGQKLFFGQQVRRLTPIECERLQAFPDDWTKYDSSGALISDSQRYKMCGNAVTTTVIQAVFEKIFNT